MKTVALRQFMGARNVHVDAGADYTVSSLGEYKTLVAARRIAPATPEQLREAFPPVAVERRPYVTIRPTCVEGTAHGIGSRVLLTYAQWKELRRIGRIAKESMWKK